MSRDMTHHEDVELTIHSGERLVRIRGCRGIRGHSHIPEQAWMHYSSEDLRAMNMLSDEVHAARKLDGNNRGNDIGKDRHSRGYAIQPHHIVSRPRPAPAARSSCSCSASCSWWPPPALRPAHRPQGLPGRRRRRHGRRDRSCRSARSAPPWARRSTPYPQELTTLLQQGVEKVLAGDAAGGEGDRERHRQGQESGPASYATSGRADRERRTDGPRSPDLADKLKPAQSGHHSASTT